MPLSENPDNSKEGPSTSDTERASYDFFSNPYYSDYVSVFNNAVPSQQVDMCFAGDSLTARGLWAEFFPDRSVANRGIGSDTSAGVLNRLDSIIALKPNSIFLMIGINDITHGIPVNETISNVQNAIETFSRELPTSTVYLESLLPMVDQTPEQGEQIRELNRAFALLAEGKSRLAYIDLYPLFIDDAGVVDATLYSADGVHLNGYGYQRWIEAISQEVG